MKHQLENMNVYEETKSHFMCYVYTSIDLCVNGEFSIFIEFNTLTKFNSIFEENSSLKSCK